MKALYVEADWDPKREYKLSQKEIESRIAYRSNMVWRNIRVAITERPVPNIADDEVLLKVGACGVCGSDIHAMQMDDDDYTLYPEWTKFPLTMGHEFSGTVEDKGDRVSQLGIGDLVAVEEMNWCGLCEACRSGRPNQCENITHLGLTKDGGFAEYVAVKEKYCWSLNQIADRFGDTKKALEAGALVEPTGVAYNGMFVQSGGIKPGSYTVIFGAGPIGLAAISLARTSGAALVIVFETQEPRRNRAKMMGADAVYDPNQLKKEGNSPHEIILDLTKGIGASLFVEAAGATAQTIPEMERALAVNGNINVIGLVAGRTPLELVAYQSKGGHVHGSSGHAGHGIFPSVIRLMATGRIDMTKAIDGRFPLNKAIEAVREAPQRSGKVLVSHTLY